jgi:maltooligosyltrehalose trehalohydrolase
MAERITPTASAVHASRRRLPVGADVVDEHHVHVRLWAPGAERVEVVVGGVRTPLEAEGGGYFSQTIRGRAGDRYAFRVDEGERLFPDPASRYQPEGPHGPSIIVDPSTFAWTDQQWRGIGVDRQVIYELHVGTFTREGTFAAAARELEELADLGVTTIEVMPIAEFDGRFGWGYDGVDLFAPSHLYGEPDDLRRFVDRAHAANVGVVLDVVYNHFGPSGNYLHIFAPAFFSKRYANEWGDALNFEGPDAGPVREFVLANAGYWIDEFHFDGLRLDATQQVFDASADHILAAVGREVRRKAGGRSTLVIAENEPQDTTLVRPADRGGYGLDALWNDDFHHSAMVALTGRAEAYYSDTRGDAQELVSAAKRGYLYQGQYYHWQKNRRGTAALDLPPARFITFLENHDQVANSARGQRGHQLTSPARWRAMTAFLLLMPSTPMLFQGQEFSASAPFLFFADFTGELADAVRRGRREFLSQFPSLREYAFTGSLDDPGDRRTFERCKLDFAERALHAPIYALHKDLLRMRREQRAFGPSAGVDGAVIAPRALLLRFFTAAPDDERLLIVNLGADVSQSSFAEPLLAPPARCDWRVAWSTDEPRYGGSGRVDLNPLAPWRIPAESAIVFEPGPRSGDGSAGPI